MSASSGLQSFESLAAACGIEPRSNSGHALPTSLVCEMLTAARPGISAAAALDRWHASLAQGWVSVFFDRIGRTCGVVVWDASRPGQVVVLDWLADRACGWAMARSMLRRAADAGCTVDWSTNTSGSARRIRLPRPDAAGGPGLPQIGRIKLPMRGDVLAARRASFQRSIQLGHALLALRPTTSPWLADKLQTTLRNLSQARHMYQLHLAFDEQGRCEGWFVWAWMSEDGLAALRRGGVGALHPSQWDEGATLCMLALVTTPAGKERLEQWVAKHWLPQHSPVLRFDPASRQTMTWRESASACAT